ncbi:TRAP transporter substrate-binding protein [Arcanobacterium hippocoleae]|uniref:Tripartite ATP-independent transporter DctP family solute receptor n=1 Tax=Arcanobacterium hippocoleae TaxID=149017 RepID=A0ABU1T3Q2_9ACTO|nr:TRAP transporter substrate-binding protein [Arcanobacterium hippocoleae]MDR6940030.1 tripartite ATP-independent transporter DctP family solute receptor [Arcanobacterium hippocoleae]
MQKPWRVSTIFAAISTLILSGCSGFGGINLERVGAADTVTYFKVALNQTEQHPSFKALEKFGADISKKTNGRYKVEVFPNEQLGSQQEVLQMVKSGAIEMAIVSGTQLENVNQDFRVLNMPTTFSSIQHQISVLQDQNIVGDLFASLADTENITVLGGYTQGARHVYTTYGPVQTPQDLHGKKIRVQESDMHIRMIELMGGSATPLSYGEVYSALQAGVLDGAENNEVSFNTARHMEVAPYYSFTNHLVGLDYMIMRHDLLAAMPAADRELFYETWYDSMDYHTQLWIDYTAESVKIAKENGAKFNSVDSAAFREALSPIVDQFLQTDYQHQLYTEIRNADQQEGKK